MNEGVRVLDDEWCSMLTIKILGPTYANCRRLESVVRQVAADQGITAQIEHVTSYQDIMRWPVLATPGLVVNERLVASGRIPSAEEIGRWLAMADRDTSHDPILSGRAETRLQPR
jgi:small redox-active disulfide protein 2